MILTGTMPLCEHIRTFYFSIKSFSEPRLSMVPLSTTVRRKMQGFDDG